MIIAGDNYMDLDLTGRTLTVREFDPDSDRGHKVIFELDSVAAGNVLGQILSTMEIITPDTIVGGWLQQAFENGLKQGRMDAQEEAFAKTNLCGPPGSQHFCEQGCCGEE